ncbi:hypothetical protein N7E02_20525 [Aliirhizobium terrae]|uniref:hypothetical protein n=1 Tax=Terrirhizobium terrae TaxID=2926709 RepID=UPI002578170B|nr:hypothetical protein [Rhizobium sp. CC-CFT758]WJH39235.1 hypothetical protein N7E02_20525 [Rhizobium sp. CC-CFT758]
MRPQRFLIPSLLLVLLASCQTMTPEERRAADQQTCASYGFKARTDGMARCLLDLELDRRARLRSLSAYDDPFYWNGPVFVGRHGFYRY